LALFLQHKQRRREAELKERAGAGQWGSLGGEDEHHEALLQEQLDSIGR
jgi:hypothetical protein